MDNVNVSMATNVEEENVYSTILHATQYVRLATAELREIVLLV